MSRAHRFRPVRPENGLGLLAAFLAGGTLLPFACGGEKVSTPPTPPRASAPTGDPPFAGSISGGRPGASGAPSRPGDAAPAGSEAAGAPESSSARTCNDSGECPKGELCKATDVDATACGSPMDPGSEVCGKGRCATPGTVCVRGAQDRDLTECLPPHAIRCGGRSCDYPRETCASDDGKTFSCLPRVRQGMSYACTGPRDCGPALQCCGSGDGAMGTSCSADCAWGNASRVCLRDDDCKGVPVMTTPAKPVKCVAASSRTLGLRFCL